MALVRFLPPVPVSVPHEPGVTFVFRKPADRVVSEARKLADKEGRQGVRDFGAEVLKAFQSGDDDEKAVRRVKKLEDASLWDITNFDRATLLRSAIVSWEGPGYVDDKTGLALLVTPDNIDDLDTVTAEWAHRTVVDMLKPPTPEAEKSRTGDAVSAS